MIDPKGNPGTFREWVDKPPIRPSEARVRARSASEGSGTSGMAGPKPACWRVDTSHGNKGCQAKDVRRRPRLANSNTLFDGTPEQYDVPKSCPRMVAGPEMP